MKEIFGLLSVPCVALRIVFISLQFKCSQAFFSILQCSNSSKMEEKFIQINFRVDVMHLFCLLALIKKKERIYIDINETSLL